MIIFFPLSFQDLSLFDRAISLSLGLTYFALVIQPVVFSATKMISKQVKSWSSFGLFRGAIFTPEIPKFTFKTFLINFLLRKCKVPSTLRRVLHYLKLNYGNNFGLADQLWCHGTK